MDIKIMPISKYYAELKECYPIIDYVKNPTVVNISNEQSTRKFILLRELDERLYDEALFVLPKLDEPEYFVMVVGSNFGYDVEFDDKNHTINYYYHLTTKIMVAPEGLDKHRFEYELQARMTDNGVKFEVHTFARKVKPEWELLAEPLMDFLKAVYSGA